jgi:hypothetical protein
MPKLYIPIVDGCSSMRPLGVAKPLSSAGKALVPSRGEPGADGSAGKPMC